MAAELVVMAPLAGLEPATCCLGGVSESSGVIWRVLFSQVRSGVESGQSADVRSGYGRWNDTGTDIWLSRSASSGRQQTLPSSSVHLGLDLQYLRSVSNKACSSPEWKTGRE